MNFLRELWTGRSPKPESSAQGTTSEGQSLKKAQCSLSGPVQDQKQCQLASSKGTTSEEKGSEKAQCSSQGPLQGQKRSRPASSQGTKSVERRAKKAKGAPSSFNDSTWYAWYLVCESVSRCGDSILIALETHWHQITDVLPKESRFGQSLPSLEKY